MEQLSLFSEEESIKNHINHTIQETNNEIRNFNRQLKQAAHHLAEIEEIKRELEGLIKKVEKVQPMVKNMEKLCIKESKSLENKIKVMDTVVGKIVKQQEAEIFSHIKHNLPDDMRLINCKDSTQKMKLQLLVKRGDNMDEITVGYMEVEKYKEEMYLKVIIQSDGSVRGFKIENPNRIYPIVNYVIEKYCYKVYKENEL